MLTYLRLLLVVATISGCNLFEPTATIDGAADIDVVLDVSFDATLDVGFDTSIDVGLALDVAVDSGMRDEGGTSACAPMALTCADIGEVEIAGSCDVSGSSLSIRASGADIWNEADAFRYAYQPGRGDFDLSMRVISVEDTNPYAKLGLMVRETLSPASRHAMVNATPSSGAFLTYRGEDPERSYSHEAPGVSPQTWVRITRTGDVFTGYYGPDGEMWTLIGVESIVMTDDVYIGVALVSHAPNELCEGEVESVELCAFDR